MTFVLVRRDSENHVEILMKEKFDSTGYRFLRIRDDDMEEWVEADKLETYRKLEGLE